jgi:hypothetical protein
MTRASQHVPAAAASDVSQAVVSSRQAKKRRRCFNTEERALRLSLLLRRIARNRVHHADQRIQRAHDLPHIPAILRHLDRLPVHLRLQLGAAVIEMLDRTIQSPQITKRRRCAVQTVFLA